MIICLNDFKYYINYTMSFTQLPIELKTQIIVKYLTVPDFLNYCRINRRLSRLRREPAIWKFFLMRDHNINYSGNNPDFIYFYPRILKFNPTLIDFACRFHDRRHIYLNNNQICYAPRPTTSISMSSDRGAFLIGFWEDVLFEEHVHRILLKIRVKINNFIDIVDKVINNYLSVEPIDLIINHRSYLTILNPLTNDPDGNLRWSQLAGTQYQWVSPDNNIMIFIYLNALNPFVKGFKYNKIKN